MPTLDSTKRKSMDVFNVRDLRTRTGDLIRDAEQGHLSIITKHGHPVFIAVPFTEELITLGVAKTLALKMLEGKHITLRQAARIVDVSIEEMMALAANANISIVDYDPKELDAELAL